MWSRCNQYNGTLTAVCVLQHTTGNAVGGGCDPHWRHCDATPVRPTAIAKAARLTCLITFVPQCPQAVVTLAG